MGFLTIWQKVGSVANEAGSKAKTQSIGQNRLQRKRNAQDYSSGDGTKNVL